MVYNIDGAIGCKLIWTAVLAQWFNTVLKWYVVKLVVVVVVVVVIVIIVNLLSSEFIIKIFLLKVAALLFTACERQCI
jgi:L-cystine uptake protein TcyP (sodium:dicarboxylate symporter family)